MDKHQHYSNNKQSNGHNKSPAKAASQDSDDELGEIVIKVVGECF